MKKGLRFWLKSSSLIKMFYGDVVEMGENKKEPNREQTLNTFYQPRASIPIYHGLEFYSKGPLFTF